MMSPSSFLVNVILTAQLTWKDFWTKFKFKVLPVVAAFKMRITAPSVFYLFFLQMVAMVTMSNRALEYFISCDKWLTKTDVP